MFGGKNIGFIAGFSLLVNSITGPGVPQLPNMYSEAGWLLPTLCILGVWAMTTLSSAMFCEAMRRMPGNGQFDGRAEYTTVVRHYLGEWWYVAALLGLNASLLSLNVASIVQSTQVLDDAISAAFGKTCALNFTPWANEVRDARGNRMHLWGSDHFVSCISTAVLDGGDAWGCHIVLTAGFALVAAMAIPCGRWNLDDNMVIQTVALSLTFLCWMSWIGISIANMDPAGMALPAINLDSETGSQAGILGTVLFNFGFVTTVPSWVNEKRPHVSVNRTLWLSTTFCIAVYIAVGAAVAAAFGEVLQGTVTNTCVRRGSDISFTCLTSMLDVLPNRSLVPAGRAAGLAIQVLVYGFPIVAVVSSIPVYSIVVKYNLLETGFSRTSAFLLAVLLPWALAFPLTYMPNALSQFINFTSLVFVTFTNFVVPCWLYIVLQRQEPQIREGCDRSVEDGTPTTKAPSSGSAASSEADSDASSVEVAFREASISEVSLSSPAVCNLPACSCAARSPSAVCMHHAIPPSWRCSARSKVACAALMASVLTSGAFVAFILTVRDSSYIVDRQVCALVSQR